jgi:hypothetical protein
MFDEREIVQAKLIAGGKEYLSGPKSNLHLISMKPVAGINIVMLEIEISKDPILFQKLIAAAEQRNLLVQIRGREFTTELATKKANPGPDFSGRMTLRQNSVMRTVRPSA